MLLLLPTPHVCKDHALSYDALIHRFRVRKVLAEKMPSEAMHFQNDIWNREPYYVLGTYRYRVGMYLSIVSYHLVLLCLSTYF